MMHGEFSSRTERTLEQLLLRIRKTEALIRAWKYRLEENGLYPLNKEKVVVWLKRKGLLPYTGRICGHTDKCVKIFTFEGHRYHMSVPLDEHGKSDHCPACLLGMTIHCARSGDPVFVGDRVALITLEETRRIPRKMTAITYEGKFLGFIAHPCAQDDWSPQGIWIPWRKGKGYFLPTEHAKRTPSLPIIERIN